MKNLFGYIAVLFSASVLASEKTVNLDFTLTLGPDVHTFQVKGENGNEAAIELEDTYRLVVTPQIQSDGNQGEFVTLSMEVYAYDKSQLELVGAPTIIAKPGKPASIEVGAGENSYKLAVTVAI